MSTKGTKSLIATAAALLGLGAQLAPEPTALAARPPQGAAPRKPRKKPTVSRKARGSQAMLNARKSPSGVTRAVSDAEELRIARNQRRRDRKRKPALLASPGARWAARLADENSRRRARQRARGVA